MPPSHEVIMVKGLVYETTVAETAMVPGRTFFLLLNNIQRKTFRPMLV